MGCRSSSRRRMLLLLATAAACALAACGGGQGPSEAETLDAVALTDDQRAIAEALLEGYRKETGAVAIDADDVTRAGCYAQHVDMPAQFRDVHKEYLADYAAIDKDFYPWFQARGISAQDAWDIAERVGKGFEACTKA